MICDHQKSVKQLIKLELPYLEPFDTRFDGICMRFRTRLDDNKVKAAELRPPLISIIKACCHGNEYFNKLYP